MSQIEFDKADDHIAEPNTLDITHGVILYVEKITVSFEGFKALNELSFYLDEGELRCIIGPNGAGKTTLIDVISGKTRPDSGSVFFGQTLDLTKLSECEIAQAGIGRKFQKPSVFNDHSVFENLELAMHGKKGVWHSLFAQMSSEQRNQIEEALETIGLTDKMHNRAGLLSHGQKQWLEIGMLLVQNPRLLLIDEPVAGMTHAETERTAKLLDALAEKHSIVVVDHDMDFVRSIARKITVLHEGRILAEGSMDEIQNNQRVIEVYLGI